MNANVTIKPDDDCLELLEQYAYDILDLVDRLKNLRYSNDRNHAISQMKRFESSANYAADALGLRGFEIDYSNLIKNGEA
jgi:hypothetical protein